MRLALIATLLACPAVAQDIDPVDAYIALRADAADHAAAELAFHNNTWQMDKAESYEIDLAAARITWTFADGHTATARAELIGTWHPNTFLWGWAHPSAPPGSAQAAQAVKDWALETGLGHLTNPQPVTDLQGADSYASMATYLGLIEGVYVTEVRDETWVYIGFDNLQLRPAGS